MIYLYVKTHNQTGLKYFGKTTRKDPFKYKGSGIRWRRHLAKHGNDVNTNIIASFEDHECAKEFAIKFSLDNNIVESSEWANLKIEELEAFPVEIEVGMMFEADDPDSDDVLIYRVTEIADGKAVVDANHPLAGMRIRFKATVTDIRPATHEEVEHGHAHGEHDHHH